VPSKEQEAESGKPEARHYRVALIIGIAVVGLLVPAAAVLAQVDAGPLSTWNDRELSVAYRLSTNETVGTLAIVPPGPGGTESSVILVFEARWAGQQSTGMPASLELRCYPRPLADQRIVRRVDVYFNVDPGTGQPTPLYFYGSNWGTFGWVAAGAEIPVVRFGLAPIELRALATGEVITGEAIGYPFVLDAAQIDAIRAFARVVYVRDTRLP
jgi:hypothetical protein